VTFNPGDRVIVNPDAFDCSPAWEGEIVGYWRNGAWKVRELVHGTTCAYDSQRLSRASHEPVRFDKAGYMLSEGMVAL
jgi:hypothetical protein